jgi:hypothetical protein
MSTEASGNRETTPQTNINCAEKIRPQKGGAIASTERWREGGEKDNAKAKKKAGQKGGKTLWRVEFEKLILTQKQ